MKKTVKKTTSSIKTTQPQKQSSKKRFLPYLITSLVILFLTISYGYYNVASGGFLSQYFGESGSINVMSPAQRREANEAKAKAKVDARKNIKKANETRRNTLNSQIENANNQFIGNHCGVGLHCDTSYVSGSSSCFDNNYRSFWCCPKGYEIRSGTCKLPR